MNVIGKVRRKLREGGVRGLVASALRYTANRLEGGQPEDADESASGDEFLAWVRFAVPGMLEPGNLQAMEHAVATMPEGKAVLEIGSFCGLSTVVLSHLLAQQGKAAALFSCDRWEFEGQKLGALLGDSTSVTHDAYRAHVKDSFLRNLRTFAPDRLPYTVECFSDEFFERWFAGEEAVDVFDRQVRLGGELGFCYIDGNHSYDFAMRDFLNCDRALAQGGLLLFDDSADGSDWEVNRLTREIACGEQYEVVSRAPNYLFRKR